MLVEDGKETLTITYRRLDHSQACTVLAKAILTFSEDATKEEVLKEAKEIINK